MRQLTFNKVPTINVVAAALIPIIGKDGINGKDGCDGKDGNNGQDGIRGRQGTAGKQGNKGLQGKVGKQGKAGTKGKDGKQGKQGLKGIGIKGEAGCVGPKGDTGPMGMTGPPPEHRWTGTALQFKNPDGTWGKQINLKGDKGIAGTGKVFSTTTAVAGSGAVYLKGDAYTDGSIRWYYDATTGLPVDQIRVNGIWTSVFIIDALNGQFAFNDDGEQVTL